MEEVKISGNGNLHFRLRFNARHTATNLYWRVFVGEREYLRAFTLL